MKRKYYIGLDGHSNNCFFVVLDGKGKIVCREKIATAENTVLQFVRKIRGQTFSLHICVEICQVLVPDTKDFPGAWHHMMHRGARRKPIFNNEEHCFLFLQLIGEAIARFGTEVLGTR